MTRRPAVFLLALGCLAFAASTGRIGGADEQPPAGLRVLSGSDSWHLFVPWGVAELAKAAGIEGHKDLGNQHSLDKPFAAGSPNAGETFRSLLMKGRVDIYNWGRPGWGCQSFLTKREAQTPNYPEILSLGLQGNPHFRVYHQMAWAVHDGLGKQLKKDDYDDSKIADVQAALDRMRRGNEAGADEINRHFGRRVFFLVPVGDAVTKLRAMVLDGKYPGLTRQSELFTDAMPHPGAHIMALAGYCHFAAFYRRSPVGMKISRFKELTDEQHGILQRLGWETVSRYPYAGVNQ